MAFKVTVKSHPSAFLKDLNNILVNKLEQTTNVIVQNSKSEAPVESGALKESIRSSVDPASLKGEVGSDLKYSINVELGTKQTPPNPFLRRGLNKSIQSIKSIFSRK